MKLSIIIIVSLTLSIPALIHADSSVPYPDGYRNWSHVKSMIILPGHPLAETDQGIHHIYANKKALQGLSSGRYPDGALLVYDLLEYVEKDKTIQEGVRKLIGVMYKNSTAFAETGGWGYEGFAGESKTERLVNDGGELCFSCHLSEKENDYVFSRPRK